jgi:arginyl-tRNA synthetase
VIREEIERVARRATGLDVVARYNAGKTRQFGDIGLPLHEVAQRLGDEAVAKVHEAVLELGYVSSVTAKGSFLNIALDRAAMARTIAEAAGQGMFPVRRSVEPRGEVLLEHTSINPNAEPHVGRARNAIIGDALQRILRATGYEVTTHYYVNDFGKQIALLHLAFGGAIPASTEFSEILEQYVEVQALAARDPATEARALDLLAAAEAGDAEALGSLQQIARRCLEGQLAILGRLGIDYDAFDFETELLGSQDVATAEARLEELGVTFVDELGRKVADLRVLGFEPDEGRYAVLRRANGSSMYMLRDIAYNMGKARAAEGGRNVVVLGEDHRLYMTQLSLLLASLDLRPPEPVYYSFVLLKDGKMSTRQGNVVMLGEFIDRARTQAGQRVAEADPGLGAPDVAQLSDFVANAAVRFALLRSSPTSTITFDYDEALRFEGATGPYVQYAAVRCGAIHRRAASLETVERQVTWSDEALDLVITLDEYDTTLGLAASRLAPNILCDQLLRVAKAFSRFYQSTRVIEGDEVDGQALALVSWTNEVLQHGLGRLGIAVPDRM